MALMDKKLVRTVYRSLLRASGNGRSPEVFGEHATTAALSTPSRARDGAPTPPSTAQQVRRLVRAAFTQPAGAARPRRDPFDALRRANELSSVLRPREETLREAGLPVFDYRAAAVMFGEELHLNLFEPRYRKLAQRATASGGGGLFVLRARPVLDDADGSSPPLSLSVLMKIVEHSDLNAETIAVRCIAGPRVRVLQQEDASFPARLEPEEPCMIVATKIALNRDIGQTTDTMLDTDSNHEILESNASLAKMRSRCLDMLCAVTPDDTLFSFGLPPLDPEYFSFWSLRLVFDSSDTLSRHTWLSCRSTSQRLIFVITLLEKFQQAKREKEMQKQSGDFKG